MSWPAVQAAFPDDGVPAETAPPSLPVPPCDQRLLARLLGLGPAGGDRRVSTAGAFFLFTFGCGSGALWTLVLIWLF